MDAIDFLYEAGARSLEVKYFKPNNPQAQDLRGAHGKLIKRMPQAAHDKSRPLETPEKRLDAVKRFVNKHSGELVEPDPA